MKKKRIIFLVFVLMAVVLVSYSYYDYTRKNKDLAQTKEQFEMASADLIQSFQSDEKSANEKYLDKIIAVYGRVKEIKQDERGHYTVVFGEDSTMASVRCSMDTAHLQDLLAFRAGDRITIRGACTGFNANELLGSDVILNRCVIKK